MATYHVKKDRNAQFFWILVSDNNGKTVAMSSEAYVSKQGARDSIDWTKANADADVEDDTK